MSDEQCPTCGYYCLGTGGVGCIGKPNMAAQGSVMLGVWQKLHDEQIFAKGKQAGLELAAKKMEELGNDKLSNLVEWRRGQ